MTEMNDVLARVMSDPGAMRQIANLAQSLGLQNSPSPPPAPPPAPVPAPPPPAQNISQDPMKLMSALLQISKSMGSDQQQLALIQALKPFLRPERAARLDMAIQVAKLSQLAGNTLKGLNTPGKGW